MILGACALIIGLFAVGMAGPEVVSVDAGIWTVSLGIMTALVPVLLLIYVLIVPDCFPQTEPPGRPDDFPNLDIDYYRPGCFCGPGA